jgi:hypothetical protein
MRFVRQMTLIIAGVALVSARSDAFDDTPAAPKAESAKDAKAEPEFNHPPKGAALLPMGQFRGKITKGSDGKTFAMEVAVNGKKKEVEINLAASTKVRVSKQSEFDDKGNPKKSARVVTTGTADDLRGGLEVTVVVSGTRDGSWLVAKLATVTGE